jgi:hypothetical protein
MPSLAPAHATRLSPRRYLATLLVSAHASCWPLLLAPSWHAHPPERPGVQGSRASMPWVRNLSLASAALPIGLLAHQQAVPLHLPRCRAHCLALCKR